MLIYILIDIAILVMGTATYQKTKKSWALAVSFVILLFFAGFRGAFTSDYQAYADYFSKIRETVTLWNILNFQRGFSMERGFVLFCKVVGYLSSSPVVLFVIVAAITLALFFSGFKKLSAMPVLTVFLFTSVGDYYATYNLTRQMLAAAIVILALIAFIQGKKWRYFLMVLIAVMIHRTALVMVPMFFLLNSKVNKKNILIFSAVGAVAFVFLPPVVRYVQGLFSAYSNYTYGMGEGTINAVIPQLGMLFFVAYSILGDKCNFDIHDRKNRVLLNAAIFSTIFMFLGMRIYIISRLAYYLKPAFWILVPNIIASYKREWDRRVVLVIICVLGVAYTYIALSGTGYEPYYFIFSAR